MFVPVLSSFSDHQKSLFQRLASAGSHLPSPAPEEAGNHSPKPTLLEAPFSHTMGGLFCHGRQRWGKMVCTRASFHRAFFSNSKTLPKPSISQPLSCPKAPPLNTPHKLMKPWIKFMPCCKDQGRFTAGNVHYLAASHPHEFSAWRQPGEGDCRGKAAHARSSLGATARQQVHKLEKIST